MVVNHEPMIAVSYRREDSLPIAGRLYDRLQAKFGRKNVFMDFDSIPPGTDFREQIKQMIEGSSLVIAIIGPHWLGEQPDASRRIDNPADFVRLEIAYALKQGIPIIPVLVNNTPMPAPEKLPQEIEGIAFRNAVTLDSGIDFHHHVDRLIAGIDETVDVGPRSDGSQKVLKPTTSAANTPLIRIVTWGAVILLTVVTVALWFLAAHRHGQEASRPAALVVTPAPSPPQLAREQPKSIVEKSLQPSSTPPALPTPAGTAVAEADESKENWRRWMPAPPVLSTPAATVTAESMPIGTPFGEWTPEITGKAEKGTATSRVLNIVDPVYDTIIAFITAHHNRINNDPPIALVGDYADKFVYFDHGTVDPLFVYHDQVASRAKYRRMSEAIEKPVWIRETEFGHYRVNYKIRYDGVRTNNQRVKGTSEVYLDLVATPYGLKIVSQQSHDH